MTRVKICGLSEPKTLRTAVMAGADWIGFNFVEKSPRYVTPAAAASLLLGVGSAVPVALLADPDDASVDEITRLGFPIIQLHGDETPARVAEVKARTGRNVWKAVGIASEADRKTAAAFESVADRLLLDTKPPAGATLKGGTGETFDWALLRDWAPDLPWMLAGGLNPDNVAAAMTAKGALAVDVSSGVERARGLKDAQRIKDFIAAAKGNHG